MSVNSVLEQVRTTLTCEADFNLCIHCVGASDLLHAYRAWRLWTISTRDDRRTGDMAYLHFAFAAVALSTSCSAIWNCQDSTNRLLTVVLRTIELCHAGFCNLLVSPNERRGLRWNSSHLHGSFADQSDSASSNTACSRQHKPTGPSLNAHHSHGIYQYHCSRPRCICRFDSLQDFR